MRNPKAKRKPTARQLEAYEDLCSRARIIELGVARYIIEDGYDAAGGIKICHAMLADAVALRAEARSMLRQAGFPDRPGRAR